MRGIVSYHVRMYMFIKLNIKIRETEEQNTHGSYTFLRLGRVF